MLDDQSGTVVRAEFDAPPPPPAFGTVINDAPFAVPLSRRPSRGPWVLAAVSVALAGLTAGYFVLSSSAPSAKPAALDPGAPLPPNSTAESAAPERAAVAVAAPPVAAPCPEGMVLVDGGRFHMGTDADDRVLAGARPAHPVEVAAFCLDRTEVTVEKYRECSVTGDCKRAYRESWWPRASSDEVSWHASREVYSTLCNERDDDRAQHPINCVTWTQADYYCKQRGKSLPTEAQWEYAARGSDGRVYSWGDSVPDSERMNGCGAECSQWRERAGLPAEPRLFEASDGYVGTAPVGSFPAGAAQSGAVDLAGNVFEWTSDVYKPYPGADTAPSPTDGRDRRVIRGGAFNSFMPQFADPALRFSQAADTRSHGIGFRCVAEPAD